MLQRKVAEEMKYVTEKSCRGNENTNFMFNYFLFFKIVPFTRHVEKYCRAGQATDDNMVHVRCMLDN